MKRVLIFGLLLALVACQGGGTAPGDAPTARFSAVPAAGAPLAIRFDASGSSPGTGSLTSFIWDFGDGESGSGSAVQHAYAAPATYRVTLTVTNSAGRSATTSQQVQVSAAAPGRVSGAIRVGLGGAGHPLTPLAVPAWTPPEGAAFVPGEVLVRFKPASDLLPQSLSPPPHLMTLQAGNWQATHVRALAVPEIRLYRGALGERETLELARALQARPDVLYAHPNYILQPFRTPDDEYFGYQWHYAAINLPAAWDITTGAESTVVAVVDSGILYEAGNPARTHPDFAGKVLPGYDFISDPNVAGDGDGRDPNPFDVGDNPGGQSSYHGSHVAGTVAAATDNGVGVAGVDWQARILPVRALGVGGGSLLDILEGMLWAAGRPVPGVPTNPHPAHVINMSLGGPGACFPAMQSFIDEALGAGAIIVVAAGNENQNAAQVSPASCTGVITVGATEFRGRRAPYSNYGSRIDVMAPGGDMTADRNGDNQPDGVLSTYYYDGEARFFYEFQQGTSMAAPHVAGVIALMRALEPDLSAQDALTLLRATARPLAAAACERPTASECGAGLIDAAAALEALRDDVTPPPAGALSLSPNPLEFAADDETRSFTLRNTGGSSLAWTIEGFTEAGDNPAPLPEGSLYLPEGAAASGTLAPGEETTSALGIDRSAVTAPGTYQVALILSADGQETALAVRFSVQTDDAPTLSGPMVVAAFQEDGAGELVMSGFQESAGVLSAYSFAVPPGEHYLIAWADENGSGEIDQGDYLGVYPSTVPVAAGEAVGGLDLTLEVVVGTPALPDAFPPSWPVPTAP